MGVKMPFPHISYSHALVDSRLSLVQQANYTFPQQNIGIKIGVTELFFMLSNFPQVSSFVIG